MSEPSVERLGALMSAIAHDLRTPLATIYGFGKTIERAGGLDDRQARFLSLMIDAAADMDRMIENVSQIGHVAEGRARVKAVATTTAALCAAAVAAIPERADGRHVVLVGGADGGVTTDPERASRALALVAEAALRLAPGLVEATIAPAGTAVRIGPFADELLPGLQAFGRDVPVEAARIVLADMGASLRVEDREVLVSFT